MTDLKPIAHEFAQNWISSWNSHKLESILAHYADDVEISTPMIKLTMGSGDGKLKGKKAVAAYWKTALKKFPDLKFELFDVTVGVDSVALYYQSVMNKRAIEVMYFNEKGEINKMFAHYS